MVKGNNATFNYSTDRARIAELEAELAALREFVVAADAYEAQREIVLRDKTNVKEWDKLDQLWRRYQDARQRLATAHELPLPEVER